MPKKWSSIPVDIPDKDDKIRILQDIIKDIHWMARRYADGRMTYATSMLNEATRMALAAGVKLKPLKEGLWARDGMGNACDGLSAEEVQQMENIETKNLLGDEGRRSITNPTSFKRDSMQRICTAVLRLREDGFFKHICNDDANDYAEHLREKFFDKHKGRPDQVQELLQACLSLDRLREDG